MDETKKRGDLLELIHARGGLQNGVAREVSRLTGVPEAEVYGAGSFFHLLADSDAKVRICQGLSCRLRGARELLEQARAAGMAVDGCSCLAACDRAPAALREREPVVGLSLADLRAAGGDWAALASSAFPGADWRGDIGPAGVPSDQLAIDLAGAGDHGAEAVVQARALGAEAVIAAVDRAGLQGRGGAGFPAAIKWRGVRDQAVTERYVVLNADEGEPGTFKDREVLLRRPELVLAGLVIAAEAIGAQQVYCYLRGEFAAPRRALELALAELSGRGLLGDLAIHLHDGHGAYICGEETALLEALQGRRGMPRLKPPFPTEVGLWGKPTLIHNVETIACVPGIVRRGGDWFRGLGRTGPGTKLYCVSGHVRRPGVYELPLGICLDELVQAAGGYDGTLRAFSPGGASSGFLPAAERTRPLDFASLAEAGSMLGSAGVVVLNDTADLAAAVRGQLRFFEVESCGQCAPCRIGTRFVREAVDRWRAGQQSATALAQVAEVAWEMNEGSICGLGQAAPLPLTTALAHFPEVFCDDRD